jgi:lysophospholipase L1-like esterase
MNGRRLSVRIAGIALGLSALAAGPAVAPAFAAGDTQDVPASDPRFRYEGRFDFSDPASPVVIWQASRIGIDFEGGRVAVRFAGVTGPVFFDATVDGAASVLALRPGMPGAAIALPVAGPGRHHLVLFKRTEATAGTARFAGIELAPGAGVFPQAPPQTRMRVEFIGDSITAGACDEDGEKDQWEDRRTHNAALSWAALTAAALSADHRNISVSGMGVATGYVDVLAGQMWDRVYPTAASPRAKLEEWIPDLVFVLLGSNDDSYPRGRGLPFPDKFTEKYVSLVRSIRAAYPKARIVLLNGAMWEGTHSEPLGKAWNSAVAELESTDPAISHFVFVHWSSNHPRVADNRILSGEAIAWLRAQPFMSAGSIAPR